jgi:hypothetical protein
MRTTESTVTELIPRPKLHARPTGGIWQGSVHRAAQTVDLPSIGARFTVDELYDAAGVS